MRVQSESGLLALSALVIQNTSLVICLNLSFRDAASTYAPSTVVLITELLKLTICSVVVATRRSDDLRAAVMEIGQHGSLFVPSMLYVLQNNLLFFGAERLSSLLYILCSQLKILTTAIMSRIILGTKLSRAQYFHLSLLIFGIVLVQAQRKEDNSVSSMKRQASSVLGVLAVVLAAWTSGTAGVVLERIFKARSQSNDVIVHTIWTRNVQLSLISLPFAMFGVFLQNNEHVFSGNFFKGYEAVVWVVVLLQTAGGIIIGYVMQFTSNIMKCLAIGLSICLCAIYSVFVGETELTANVVLGILLVFISIAGYSLHSSQDAHKCVSLSPDPVDSIQRKQDVQRKQDIF